ncbi:MAG: hypothetical protein ACFE0O_09390 [Opitutales bacterium]
MRWLAPVGLLLFSLPGLRAQALEIEVRDVRFEQTREDWIIMRIELRAGRNTLPDARNDRFIDDVLVRAIVSYEAPEEGFDFYTAEARIISLETAENRAVYFCLPPEIVERDELRKDPFAWLVELEVLGNTLPIGRDNVSSNIPNAQAVASFQERAAAAQAETVGIFRPHYLAPPGLVRAEDTPSFYRTEPELP